LITGSLPIFSSDVDELHRLHTWVVIQFWILAISNTLTVEANFWWFSHIFLNLLSERFFSSCLNHYVLGGLGSFEISFVFATSDGQSVNDESDYYSRLLLY